MREVPWLLAEPHRIQVPGYQSRFGDSFGAFVIPHAATGAKLRCLAQDGRNSRADLGNDFAWDHVSVSLPNRCPNWPEMDYVRTIFWRDDETVMQLHVPRDEHVNCHPTTLHLWRPLLLAIPRPPQAAV